LALAALLSAGGVWAQAEGEDPEDAFRGVSAQKALELRQILAEPLAKDALKTTLEQQILAKRHAAKQLGAAQAEESVLREALEVLPSPGLYSDLALNLAGRGEFDEAIAMHLKARELAGRANKPFYAAHLANDESQRWRHAAAQAWLKVVRDEVASEQSRNPPPAGQRALWRALRFERHVSSIIAQREGRWNDAIAAAQESELYARKALETWVGRDSPLVRLVLLGDLGNALARRTQSLRAAGRLALAEQALRDYIRLAKEESLPAAYHSGVYITGANLRFAQGEYRQSELLARKSIAVLEDQLQERVSFRLAERKRDLALALAAQGKWADALGEFQRMDARMAEQKNLSNRTRFRFDRGYIYLGNGRHAEAAEQFEWVVQANRKTFGEGHFFVVQAQGLLGVALWQSGQDEAKAKALALLGESVQGLVHPRNADYLEAYGIRAEVRRLILSTYIEALAQQGGPAVLEAVGLADWLRGSATQEALSDAAVRAAADTPGLAELVRKEQDMRQEIRGLRDYLGGEAGAAQSPLPGVADQMRRRIAELELQRQELQGKIRQGFPGYEKLVRPMPPSLTEIGAGLGANELLVVLMPDARGVNVWAIKQENRQPVARFHRANVDQATLQRMVNTLRRSFESLSTQAKPLPFDGATAHALYRQLLEPLAPFMADRAQWLVAASGAMAQLPLAVLQTSAPGPAAPRWLLQQASLSQIPSVGAWLQLRQLKRQQRPTEALIAWGDPVFDPKASAKPTGPANRNLSSGQALADLESNVPDSAALYHQIPPLPETRDELLSLARTLGADPQRDLILGAAATRSHVLQTNRSGLLARKAVIAFATHGLVAGDLPLLEQPALALSATGEESRNGLAPLLTLEDVLSLKLNADWVILSACNTAAGDGRGETSLSGLARGFFYAGGRSLLVTHWAVESESAKELTSRTLAHYKSHPDASKSESLRAAMLSVMAEPAYAHPAFWAPYALVGENQR